MSGELDVEARPQARPRWLLPLALFLLTVVSTTWAHGPAFSATLLAILVSHEMGHYLVARRHGVDASLPHFIPLPPFFMLGTLGAVITMRTDRADRGQLLDIGAAGPIAGFAVAVPLMALGIVLSTVEAVPKGQGLTFFGDSLLSWALQKVLAPPIPPGHDLFISPVFLGAWGGFLVTAINLLPMGQLDGGHVLYAVTPRSAEVWARRVYVALIVLGVVGLLVHGPVIAAAIAPEHVPAAWVRAARPLRPWFTYGCLVWALLGKMTGIRHPPVLGTDVPLSPRRRATAALCLAILLLAYMPSPIWLDGGPDPQ